MSRIDKAFEDHKALITFITGGDPNLETTEKLVPAMAKAGADLIEIGIPFSDPIAEGPVIQDADERSLKAGCTTDKLFDTVGRIREKTDVPLLFMTYLNPIFTYGKADFMRRCAECGIDGVIVPDLPYEEKGELADVCSANGIDLVSLIAPTSKERIGMIARESEGFVYCVSSLGVTGVRSEIKTDIKAMTAQVRAATSTPCAVGFGISTPEQAAEMADIADGAIIGSAIVKMIAKYGPDCVDPVTDFVKSIRNAIDDKFDKENHNV